MTIVSFMPAPLDLELYSGDRHDLVIELWTDDAATVPRSISGLTFTSMIRKTRKTTDASQIWTLTVVAHQGSGIVDPTTLTVTIPKTITAALPTAAVWDLQETNGSGDPETLYTGTVTTTMDVTR